MSQKEFEYQLGLIDKHLAKAEQCLEYGKPEDADVHIMVARILRKGLSARFEYEKEALLNTAQAVS